MFAKNFCFICVLKGLFKPHAPGNISKNNPIGTGLSRRWQNSTLAAYQALRIGHSAVFFSPSRCGQQHIGKPCGVGLGGDVADHDKGAVCDGITHSIGLGHRDRRVCVDDPKGLDLPFGNSAEHIDRFKARFIGNFWHPPKPCDCCAVICIFQIKVTCEHIRQTANLAPAHGIWLSGH